MRDLFAAIVALGLLLVAASLATTLTLYRRRRQRTRDSERALGRSVVAELPISDDLVLFSEDHVRFYYGERRIDKDLIVAASLLINGAPVATAVSDRPGGKRHGEVASQTPPLRADEPAALVEDRPDGILRDRWDVAIETVAGTVLIECGSIRERVSQELARAIFNAVKAEIERRHPPERRPSDTERAS